MLYKKFVCMDVKVVEIKLHPLASDYLFKYYDVLRRIFSQVLGQLETDYISIGLVDQLGQLFFFSSKPSLEHNLIEKNLFTYDVGFQSDFVYQDKPHVWTNSVTSEHQKLLYQYKQSEPGLMHGISIPTDYHEYRAIFSFGFRSPNVHIQQQYENFLAIGRYCLKEITKAIAFPDQKELFKFKPHLKLIVNNQEHYETNPR